MKHLRLAFSDGTFDGFLSHFDLLLRQRFDLEVVQDLSKAHVLMYSDRGTTHQRFNGRKIYYTIENMMPDYNECDFAITSGFRPDDTRHYRLPYYALASNPQKLTKEPTFSPEATLSAKTGFCSFVATNPRSPERNQFFKILNKLKRVDSGGRHFNNIGHKVSDKLAFVSQYKFAIAFENTASPGYTTEKITDAMTARTIPIYWGNPEIVAEFNTRSFINAADFPTLEALANHVIKVDRDDDLYLRYLREPWFINNQAPEAYRMDLLSDALVRFIESNESPRVRNYQKRRLRQHLYQSPWEQTIVSFRCRLESRLWAIGIRW